jgi:hypothetical protein
MWVFHSQSVIDFLSPSCRHFMARIFILIFPLELYSLRSAALDGRFPYFEARASHESISHNVRAIGTPGLRPLWTPQ